MDERILTKARELFFAFGLRGVTMDVLAREMGISKKTLYQYFADKVEIVEKVIMQLLAEHKQEIESCRNIAANAVEEVLLQSAAILKIFLGIKPGFFNEVEKYYPQVWTKIMSHEKEILFGGIQKNIKNGIAHQLYRAELNLKTTAYLRLNQIKSLFTPTIYDVSYYDVKELAHHLTDLYLHGITTPEGKQLINNYQKLKSQE